MTVTSVDKDYDRLTVTLTADFEAPVDRVWELWSDPRKLERWMGPPGAPATVDSHDLSAGGEISFSMAGPDGQAAPGVWRVTAVDPPRSLEFTDAFAEAEMSVTRVRVELTERDGGTRMTVRSSYGSREDMDQRLGMGELEGWQAAVGQMDDLLAG
jgi:uncharacterized protein YndB with AHSA1/START domain